MPGVLQMYKPSETAPKRCLRQGELFSDIHQFRLDLDSLGGQMLRGQIYRHPIAVLLTQDCDLEQDSKARFEQSDPEKTLPSLLFCEVATAEELRGTASINSTVWAQVKVNKHERYQFLQKVEAHCDAHNKGLPEMGIDFKRYFTIPCGEVYRRIELGEAQRRCLLVSPYLEHLCGRFANYLSRIALPLDHISD